ncbi:DUF2202 domain-containing protein [Actinoplanes sp. LDG1-06]|uniref:DUF2202 domain-containing protein n=1 Tax=Paractinoplanes ovalisporus TaxID=2810368 RepID=A0ABS2A9C0_9ACTN|nr:DUF2202 domain-containing protein [Actinoplanes ovalisporus]MBM2616422.1 DUF2202 domain-containing protein [Actinoplanes ovalisporus]
MKTNNRRAAMVVTVGAIGLTGIAIAAPALADDDTYRPRPASTATANPGGYGMGIGQGMGSGSGFGFGFGFGGGMCGRLPVTAPQGTLTAAQKATLASMAQEEKLAQDLHGNLGARYDAFVFEHIAVAETQHLNAVRAMLQRYRITDPTAGQAPGAFTDSTVQATYDKLLAQGTRSRAAALAVGQQVERDDIAALNAAADGLTAPDVQQLYARLSAGSQRHLAAFTHWADR